MARAKKDTGEPEVIPAGSLISNLIKDTDFKFIGQDGETGKGSLTDKLKVETPVYALNDLLGGGIPLGCILEVFGPNASGKSSLMYETLGNFQRQYPNGVAFIIDSESSTDDARLRQLGVDPMRAPRMGAGTLEDGFEQIVKILNKMVANPQYKDFPVMIIWDTIAATPTRAQAKEGGMYAGGMAEKARIIKSSLSTIFSLVEKQNVLLVLLNQVMAEIGGWHPGVTSSGGNALKHDVHLKFEINGGKTEFSGVFATTKESKISITKSKVSPIMNNIPITLDITQGGVIDREKSLVDWMTELNIFKQAAWWQLEDWAYARYKAMWDKFGGFVPHFRKGYLFELAKQNPDFVAFLRLIWVDMISERYTLQREVCKEVKDALERQLIQNLGLTYEEMHPSNQESIPEPPAEVSPEDALSTLSTLFNQAINQTTGEVIEEE